MAEGSRDVASVLGGEWRKLDAGRCFVVEHRVDARSPHGRRPVGAFAAEIEAALAAAPILTNGTQPQRPLVFFDLETTGLSGGAGSYAFLIGCGWFDCEGGFVVRQYVLTRLAEEPIVLRALAEELARAGALVSFNGKTFDAPVLETRYLYHRLTFPASAIPHLDMLHPARRFWGSRTEPGGAHSGFSPSRRGHIGPPLRIVPGGDLRGGFYRVGHAGLSGPVSRPLTACSLGALERHVLGASRAGDVPGFEIPARYFQYLRSGDARPLQAVLEHNRLDLLSLAGITARLLSLVDGGCEVVQHAAEALGLGRVYARAGLDDRASAAYRHAVAAARDSPDGGWIRIEALRSLALGARRSRRFGEAAEWWRQLLAGPDCPRDVAHEAREALAIHHEHRLRDLETARAFALRLLDAPTMRPALTDTVRHRLARIEQKIETGRVRRALLDPPEV